MEIGQTFAVLASGFFGDFLRSLDIFNGLDHVLQAHFPIGDKFVQTSLFIGASLEFALDLSDGFFCLGQFSERLVNAIKLDLISFVNFW
ncbi:MAG: hypothetical protein NTV38_11510 [Chloroflexi bacterium]|nr:hypothetical protein [Chloroflexota bacterium]